MPGLYKKHTATQPIMPEMRLEPLNVCLPDRHLNQLSRPVSEQMWVFLFDTCHVILDFKGNF